MSQVAALEGAPAAAGGAGTQGCSGANCLRPCQGQGMSNQTQVDRFGVGMAQLQRDWDGLSPTERKARLQTMVSDQAQANGFPPPRIMTPPELGDSRLGELRFTAWQVAVNPRLLDRPSLDAQQAASLGDTLFHETRHAEQWYLIARRQAAEGLSAQTMQTQLQVPLPVTTAAAAEPMVAQDPRRACADAMYNSVYGNHAAQRNATLGELSTKGQAYSQALAHKNTVAGQLRAAEQAVTQAQGELNALSHQIGPAPAPDRVLADAKLAAATVVRNAEQARMSMAENALRLATNDYNAIYPAYRALPEEADAWDAGGRAARAISDALALHPASGP